MTRDTMTSDTVISVTCTACGEDIRGGRDCACHFVTDSVHRDDIRGLRTILGLKGTVELDALIVSAHRRISELEVKVNNYENGVASRSTRREEARRVHAKLDSHGVKPGSLEVRVDRLTNVSVVVRRTAAALLRLTTGDDLEDAEVTTARLGRLGQEVAAIADP